MSDSPDFEFAFGKGRQLKGRGWRGLFALALLLATSLLVLGVGAPGLEALTRSLLTVLR